VNLFAVNLVLAAAWCGLLGAFSLTGLAVGFLASFAALGAAQPLYGAAPYFRRLPRLAWLGVYFLQELVVSSWKVALAVLAFRRTWRPGIIALPLDCRSDLERATVANMITLTPGTLSLEFSDDRGALYVHGMFVDDPEAVRRELKDGMERAVLRALR
jgi:multicomponent Na+:H+ antiporter subunit E